MQRILFFKLIITFATFIVSANGQTCSCTANGGILQCSVTSISSAVDTSVCNPSNYNSISITYSGNVTLSVNSPSTNPIVIGPYDNSDNHTLQISYLNTNADLIKIQIRLSPNQNGLPLFNTQNYVIPSTSALSISVTQSIPDASNLQIFDNSVLSIMNLAKYTVTFDNGSNAGILNFPNLIRGLRNVSYIFILGNNHYLAVNQSQMPSSITINQLSLQNLTLYDQLFYNVSSLNVYSIEQCTYNKTAKFLNSDRNYSLSLTMKNNNPVNLVLPNTLNTFDGLGNVTSITLIEPNLNSSVLIAIKNSLRTSNLYLQLSVYYVSDFSTWQTTRPLIWQLTINNIPDLSIFPSRFFSTLDAIQQVTLQGAFGLEKSDICAFVGINIQPYPKPQIVILNSPEVNTNNWDQCADTYIRAINQQTTDPVYCPPDGTEEDCGQWCEETAQCNLVSYENACPGTIISNLNNFRYNNSYLFLFFQQHGWLNQTMATTQPTISQPSPLNIGAIVGAVCGLVIAIIILGTTVYCIYRNRHKDLPKTMFSTPHGKYTPSGDDSTHLSIATSKTSKSSRYELQKSFFPPMQPHDEIAPPLYSAPSESVGSISAYKSPSAPPAPRDSVSTHATHIYETLDP